MNQSFQPGGATGLAAEPRPEPAVPAQKLPPPLATRRDIEALAAALGKGETAVARRRDLAELLRRTTAALDDRAASADATRAARFDLLERRLDSVEGALRIELAPMIGRLLSDELAARPAGHQTRHGLGLGLALAFAAGVLATLFYQQAPAYFNAPEIPETSQPSSKISVRPLPNGGSAVERNPVN